MTLCDSYAMKRNGTPNEVGSLNHSARFLPVVDSRKRKIRGLWQRGSKYYAQLRMDDGSGITKPKRIPLDADNLDAAKSELEKVRTSNRGSDDPGQRCGNLPEPAYSFGPSGVARTAL